MAKNKIKVYTKDRGLLDIKVVPNQKVIKINKVNDKRGCILDIQTNKQAMKDLSSNAYMLYMHFVLNIPGYEEALSFKHLTENTSLSERSYYKSINELIDKGYLLKVENKDFPEYYHFYEKANISVSTLGESEF